MFWTNLQQRTLKDESIESQNQENSVKHGAVQDPGCDSAIGCLLGLTLGDAVGAPLEFCAVDASPQAPKIGTVSHVETVFWIW